MWDDRYLSELQERRQRVAVGGGAERIEKQHAAGKLTARERMELLFDEGSFTELDTMMEAIPPEEDFGLRKKLVPGDGVVIGCGTIHGRKVFASSQDFTVIGGALGETQATKICRAMDLAYENRAPFVSINDSGGARIEEGICALDGYGRIFYRNTRASGVIPQISVILGPCAGGASYSPAISDFIFMTKETSKMFITGPGVTKEVTGEVVSFEELGGAEMHATVSGVNHFVFEDDKGCLEGVRRLLSYLPDNNASVLVDESQFYAPEKVDLQEVVPDNQRKTYDVRTVITQVADKDSFLEIQEHFAQNIVIGFVRVQGKVAGVVANQPSYMGGCLDVNASDKGARFIRFCDCFGIPIVTFVDVPGFLPGLNQERNGIIRHGAKILYAYSEATVPKISLVLRKAYGGAYIAMNSKATGADIVYAWPIAQLAVMGAEGAVEIIYRKEIQNAENPVARRQELIDQYNAYMMTPYIAAKKGYVDEVILPEESRRKIADALRFLQGKKGVASPARKHGNIPL